MKSEENKIPPKNMELTEPAMVPKKKGKIVELNRHHPDHLPVKEA
jgi:hypothetical protein